MIQNHYLLKITRTFDKGKEHIPIVRQKNYLFLINAKKRMKEQYDEQKKMLTKNPTSNSRFNETIREDYIKISAGNDISWTETEWFVM